jgi:hypothetical protein
MDKIERERRNEADELMRKGKIFIARQKIVELNVVKSEAGDRDKPDLAGIQRASHELRSDRL